MTKEGFRLVIKKPKARLVFAAATRVKPAKKQGGRRFKTPKSNPILDL